MTVASGSVVETRAFSLPSAFLRLQLGHRLQGLVDPFFPLTGGPFPSLLLPPARSPLHPAGAVPGSGRPASISPGSVGVGTKRPPQWPARACRVEPPG